ncbi:LysM peptidoglycan-binding domain-containing protein [Catenulispora sp. NL8]|uniref:LysM peptidoglycan-binding domain-containing protein n=1 Tax=Catenulispora pinistramenti TaxID=2705254 RepID=A0ABS5KNU7_9ACTN|nr:LysM peptidoglycan-binding domain-containing protein [Catenulispora pinistramenti]MBS2547722.1 LysM peptidoglycan-binding domain-containing protein [Catenulispora pinistramenti]
MRPARQTSPLRRLREIAVGLLSLLVLLAATLGLPVLLYVVTKGLLPHHTPTTSGVRDLFTKKDNGSTLLAAVAIVAWLGWAAFAVSVLIEIPARLSGRAAIRVPGLGWSQKTAAGLLSGIALLLTAAPGLATVHTAVPHLPTVVATTAYSQPAQMTTMSQQINVDSHGEAHTTTYVVQPGDSLWKIAEDHLGSGDQYPAIAALNDGHVMRDGTVFHAEVFLQPGWTLQVPVRAVAEPVPAHTGMHDTAESQHVVQQGESLSEIAGHDYGDSAQWPRIFAANEGAEQNGGHFTDPNLIFPGERLTIPYLPAPSAAPGPSIVANPDPANLVHHAPMTPSAPSQTQHDDAAKAVESIADALGDTERPATSMAPSQYFVTSPQGSADSFPPSGSSASAVTASEHEQNILLVVFGISGISASTLLALLAQRRKIQQNRRVVGHRIAMPGSQAAGLERQLRAGADPANRDFLDRALRTLAKHSADTGRLIPEVAAAIVREGGVELRLSHPCPPIAPFAALNDAAWWCAKDQAKLLARKAAAEQPIPYPALVMMGQTGGGEPVLLDLEHYGVVEIGGDQRQAAGVVRSLGVELPWSDYVSVAPAGISLDPALARNQVRRDPPEQVLPALEQWAQAVGDALPEGAGSGTEALRMARIGQTNPGVTEPRVLLGAGEWVTPQRAEQLSSLAQRQPRASTAAVIAVGDSVVPVGHRITVDGAGEALFHDLNLSVTMQRVDEEQHGRLMSVVSPTQLPSIIEPGWQVGLDAFNRAVAKQPSSGEPVAQDTEHQEVWVRTLGTIDVWGTASVTDPKLVETAAYLALHPGTGITGLSTELGIATQAAGTRLAQIRDAFGLDHEGSELLLAAPDGRFGFTERVGCDWTAFEEHRRNGRFMQALAFVRGEPFADAWPGRYAWAEPYRQVMISTIIDVAHTLAQTCREDRDFESARYAVSRGLLAVPYAELLYRDLMLVVGDEARPDRDEELATLFATFSNICDEHGIEPMPDTVAVMQQLNGLGRKTTPGLRSVS